MLFCRTFLRFSQSTLSLKAAVEFARATGALHDDKCNEYATVITSSLSSLSPCLSFDSEEDSEHANNGIEMDSSACCNEREVINVNTPLFTCADPLHHDSRLHSSHKHVHSKYVSPQKKSLNPNEVSSLNNNANATVWERYVEMEQEEVYSELHKGSDVEIAVSPQMTNQIVIEGVVHSVCAGYRPHHGGLTEIDLNGSIISNTCTADNSSNNKNNNNNNNIDWSKEEKNVYEKNLSSTQELSEVREMRKVVHVLSPHRVNGLLVQVWLYCRESESIDSAITPLAVCSYVTLDALDAMYGGDKLANLQAHNESSKSPSLSSRAEMSTKRAWKRGNKETCSKEEIAAMVHELIASLEQLLLLQPVVVRGSLKMEMFFDGDVNRVVQVPVVWLPDNAIRSGFYLLPINQKRGQYIQQLKKL